MPRELIFFLVFLAVWFGLQAILRRAGVHT